MEHLLMQLNEFIEERERYGPVWTGIVCFSYHPGIYSIQWGFHIFSMPVAYGYFTMFVFSKLFGSVYQARTFIPKQIRPSINMVENDIDLYNNLGTQRFSILDSPTRINIRLVLQFGYPWVCSLDHGWCWLLVPMHSPTHRSNIGLD